MKKIILSAFVACSVGLAFAETGKFETVSNGTASVATNDFGNSKYSITNTNYTSRVINSNVSFFKVGDISASQCLGLITVENSNTIGNGSCLAVDTDNDKWRLNYVRGDSTPQVGTGNAELIGLTGKYSGMKGTCNYDQKRIVMDGLLHVSTLLNCSVSK